MVEENFHCNPRVAPNKMIHSLIKKTHGQSKTQTADRRVGVKLQTDGKMQTGDQGKMQTQD